MNHNFMQVHNFKCIYLKIFINLILFIILFWSGSGVMHVTLESMYVMCTYTPIRAAGIRLQVI